MIHSRFSILACIAAGALCAGGCSAQSQWVEVRDTPRNPLAGTLDLVAPGGPKPTDRTMQLLRRYDLVGELKGDRAALLSRLEDIQRREPDREHEYAMAEIAYITATQSEKLHRQRALEFYGTALTHAFRYLFEQGVGGSGQRAESHEQEYGVAVSDSVLRAARSALNPYDPQFRGASDLYNQSLEGMLRLVRQDGELRPGVSRTVQTANHRCSFDVVMRGSAWRAEDVDRIEFVSDFKLQGLRNHYHDYGLGVPLIAVRRDHAEPDQAERYYPPNVCFPLTAFLRVEQPARVVPRRGESGAATPLHADPAAPQFVLELHDPLDRQSIVVASRDVPLEADLSTPLAYFLNQPEFQDADLSTKGLLYPGDARSLQGLYMLEPFDPNKMPVVMVHGLWSSPITWMEMYNDLRSDPLLREHYQFWFYLYPTGQPFWISASQMRENLALMRRNLDPNREAPALDQMVLVGHSMGGLISKLQTVESNEAFWNTMSEHPFAELRADPDVVRSLAGMCYFRPNPSVRSVVTLGTPHRGSPFANGVTRWLGAKLITLPTKMLDGRDQLLAQNRDFFRNNAPLEVKTSIDSLSPDSPILPVLLSATPGPWVSYHNVVGHDPEPGLEQYLVGEGDGVVSLTSARLDDMRQLESQIIVPADHSGVHRHPQSVLEVRRVLFEQLAELQEFPNRAQIASRTERQPNTALRERMR
jgi:pimeloyl-ACP methyl ester carboxylesterase